MTDKTLEALRRIKAHAEELGVLVDRVEVNFSECEGIASIEFTAFYKPKPLAREKACMSYTVTTGG
jgi:hypothetical protein